MFRFILATFFSSLICDGFLFDALTTPRVNTGSGITDKHYFALIDMIMQEKQMREEYMLQIKQKILENESKIATLNATVDKINVGNLSFVENNEFIHRQSELMQKYLSLEANFKSLEQNLAILQLKYNSLNSEKKQLEIKLNLSETNVSLMKQELNDIRSLINFQEIGNLRNVSLIFKQELVNTNNRVDALALTQEARGQDLLALLNQTVNTALKVNSLDGNLAQLGLTQNETYRNIQQQFQQDISKIDDQMQKVHRLQNETLLNIQEVANNLSASNKKVAVTACVETKTFPAFNPIPFYVVITSYGLNSLSTLTNNGLFTCETSGLYIVSVSIMSNTNDVYFLIYKNKKNLVSGYTHNVRGIENMSSTAAVVIHLDVNDTISVQPTRDVLLYSHTDLRMSCLTVVQI